ncbi:DNA-directed polymeras-like protein kappa [Calycina marina]|uniref:DNA polymerase kappa n=1 Tax=Calycina marina TaxID=1763456 RepID=A0A9P7YY77_9HELO|nr:DNA-directed polymeras-like protein kappa [Calycina marina]
MSPVTEEQPQSDVVKEHGTLKYSLLGPSLTKPGQNGVDQQKVSEIIYEASKGSKYFNNEEARDKNLTQKIERISKKKEDLERLDLGHDRRKAEQFIDDLEVSRDLSQTIVHIDCDAFYAAVEELDKPELKDVPFSVGKGVLTTCNYHARKFGCRSGMAGFVAKKLCPQLIQIPLNFDKYAAKAQEVRKIIVDYDPRFESASIDEAYLNITEYCNTNNIEPAAAVEQLRKEVHEKTHITISAGIAANAKLAKICSNQNKPNGQYQLPNDRNAIMAFMRDLPTRKVNGVGRVFERELDAVGIKTCGDIYACRQYLSKLFGEKAFVFLTGCYLGLGRTSVQPAEEFERKSVGTESTFGEMSGPSAFHAQLRWTAEELEKDMVRAQFKGRTLCLKIKLHTYEVFTRQVVPQKPIFEADDLYKYALPMLVKLEQEFPRIKLRLMGLRCTHLVSMKKPDTLAFFGFKTKAPADVGEAISDSSLKRKAEEMESEKWETYDERLFEDAERLEREDELKDLESLGQEFDKRKHHGKEIVPNPKRTEAIEEEWWDCPICSRPQTPDEKEFNEHIDLCLSRQTIRDVVQESAVIGTNLSTLAPPKKMKLERGKSKPSSGDPKQRKLFFG